MALWPSRRRRALASATGSPPDRSDRTSTSIAPIEADGAAMHIAISQALGASLHEGMVQNDDLLAMIVRAFAGGTTDVLDRTKGIRLANVISSLQLDVARDIPPGVRKLRRNAVDEIAVALITGATKAATDAHDAVMGRPSGRSAARSWGGRAVRSRPRSPVGTARRRVPWHRPACPRLQREPMARLPTGLRSTRSFQRSMVFLAPGRATIASSFKAAGTQGHWQGLTSSTNSHPAPVSKSRRVCFGHVAR